jgi:hypothetical protein
MVTTVINPRAFMLGLPKTFCIHNVFHSSLLKPFISRPGEEVHPPSIVGNDENEHEVSLLIDRRSRKIRTYNQGR